VNSKAIATEDQYLGEHHVYEPHRVGLPPIGPYFREIRRRRGFAFELARTQMHAANTDTALGQVWLVLNPMLLAAVYYILTVVIVSSASNGKKVKINPDLLAKLSPGQIANYGWESFGHLTSSLFLFFLIATIIQTGANSVIQGGALIMNTPFPKMLLPLSSTYLAFRRYLPTLLVYIPIHFLAHRPINLNILWAVPMVVEAVAFGFGLAMLFGTLQVYFRDVAGFLPYFIRIWLYLSPVIYYVEALPPRMKPFMILNPLYPIAGGYGEALSGHAPSMGMVLGGAAWALSTCLIGGLLFMSREREFAVRL
jgi:ABC-type polysaccharide/polyol phosphate export permease